MNTSNNSPAPVPIMSGGDGGIGSIFLIGFMGSGKTYWGKIWSLKSGMPFYDLDEIIEQQQKKAIAQIFEEDGEAYFRNLETETLQNFYHQQNCIIACGGGTPCFNNNMQWMNVHGTTVYLKATPAEIVNRVTGEQEKRPLIKNLTPQELYLYIEKKIAEREEFYLQAKKILPVLSLTENTIDTLLTQP